MSNLVKAIEFLQEEIRDSASFNSMDAKLLSELDKLKVNSLENPSNSVIIANTRSAIRNNGSSYQPQVDKFLQVAQLYNNDLSTNQSMPINNTPGSGDIMNEPVHDDKSMSVGEDGPKSPEHKVVDPTDITMLSTDLIQKIEYAKDAAYACCKNVIENRDIATLYLQMYKKLDKLASYAEVVARQSRKQ